MGLKNPLRFFHRSQCKFCQMSLYRFVYVTMLLDEESSDFNELTLVITILDFF